LIEGVGCEVVAEAVETSAQADILRAMGCDTIQGYVFAEPMVEADYLDWTRDAAPGEDRIVA
jgi:EAL domain-containing protein (putative c-di-GMP-specific phosphodiesterase class I)